jgi:hypothetical protein
MNGTVLSAMVHSAGANQGDVEGLLFGSRQTRTTSVASDSQEAIQHSETSFVVSSFTAAPSFSFYSRDGTVDAAVIQQIAEQRSHLQLLGWFVCRRNTALKPSIREFAVHQSLIAATRSRMQKCSIGIDDRLLFGMLTFKLAESSSTQSLEYTFGEWTSSTGEFDAQRPENNTCFVKRGVQILNLPRNAQAAYEELVPNSSSVGLSIDLVGEQSAAPLQPSSGADVQNLEHCFDAKSKEINVSVPFSAQRSALQPSVFAVFLLSSYFCRVCRSGWLRCSSPWKQNRWPSKPKTPRCEQDFVWHSKESTRRQGAGFGGCLVVGVDKRAHEGRGWVLGVACRPVGFLPALRQPANIRWDRAETKTRYPVFCVGLCGPAQA